MRAGKYGRPEGELVFRCAELIALLLCLHLHLVSETRERQNPLQQVVADL